MPYAGRYNETALSEFRTNNCKRRNAMKIKSDPNGRKRPGARLTLYRFLPAALCVLAVVASVLVFSGAKIINSAEEEPMPQIYIRCDSLIGTEQKDIDIQFSGYNYTSLSLNLVRVDLMDLLTTAQSPENADNKEQIKFKSAESVREWKVKGNRESGDSSRYINISDKIKNPGPGVYMLYATTGKTTRFIPFIVTDLAMISKREGTRTVLFVTNRFTGTAVNKADVFTLKEGKIDLKSVTGKDGVAELPIDAAADSLPVVARWKGHVAFMNVYNWYSEYFEGYTAYTVTDRPVYRPGHEVNYKSTIRYAKGNVYSLPDGVTEAEIEIKDSKNNTVLKEKKTLNDFGALSGKFKLGEEPPIGQYQIVVRVGGQEHWQSFTVEEYRKPEFEVVVTPDKARALLGDSITFDIDVKYYFGEPVKDAELRYEVNAAPVYSYWGWGRYSWYYDEEDYSYSYGSQYVTGGELRTDDHGKASVTVDTDKDRDNDLIYTLTAFVTDKSRRQVAGAGSVKATRAEFTIYLDTDRYMYKPSDTIKISAQINSHDGTPVAEQAVDFEISMVSWDEKRNYERSEEKIFVKTAHTNKNGKAALDFVPDRSGYFSITGRAKDTKGNTVSAYTTAYAMDNSSSISFWGGGGADIVLDKDSYALGDTARALITGAPGASVLVSLEADRIYKYAVLELKDGSALFEFTVTEEMQPNVYITTAMVKDNSYDSESKNLVVPPDHKFLDITVSADKAEYKPGENATFTVTAKDSQGKPAADAELSLGVVDESIYALQPENIPDARKFFYGRRWNKVATNVSLWEMAYRYGDIYDDVMTKGMEMAEEMPMAAPAMADMDATAGMARKSAAKPKDGEGALVQPEIRSNFSDTAAWYAHLVTDKNGAATVTFPMPDSLTTWRATARAITGDTKVGNSTGETIVRKNLLVRLETPRFFTQDDKLNIVAVVHNYLATNKKVKCVLNAKGVKLIDGGDKTITVPSGGDVRVEWPAVVESPQDAWITVKALTDEESDAMQLTIPVLPHGIRRTVAASGEADKDKTPASLKLPANAIKGATALRISAAPSIAAAMFESLDYLVGYPYGCVEQTMSRFLPNIIVGQAMQKLNLPASDKLKELPDMFKKGHDRLQDMQHDDGGWGWWKNDTTHAFMTAYVIYGLANATKADYPVDKDMYNRGITALRKLIEDEKDTQTLSYMLFALSETGENLPSKRVDAAIKNYKKINAYSQALLAIVMERSGNHDKALEIIRALEKSAAVSGPLANWNAPTDRWGWMDNTIETTAYVLKAIMAVDQESAIAPKVVRYLVSRRNGNHWYSTKDTAAAVMALTDYTLKREVLEPDLDFTVSVNGVKALSGHFSKEDVFKPALSITLDDIKDKLVTGENKIEITRGGKGKLYYTAHLEWFASEKKIQSQNNGIHVSRYYSFDKEGKNKLRHTSQIKPGDEIFVHLAAIPKGVREYVIIEDMLPSGFEVVKEEQDDTYYYGYWRWWYPQKEIRDDKVAFFATRMNNGETYDMTYRIRAEIPGTVSALPARAWLMYFPEIGGHSDEHQFNVIEK